MSTNPDVIREQVETTRGELSSDVDALTDKVNPRRMAAARVERGRGRLGQIKDKVMGTAPGAVSGAARQASNAASSVSDRARAVPQMSRERTEGSPLAAGLIAFGAGLLAASLIPPSQRERQLAAQAKHKAMERSGDVKQQAGGMAREMQQNLRDPALHAAQSVRTKAAESASAVRDQGMSSGQQVRGRAERAARKGTAS
jgi:Protein of unknown function (DUF3618)